VNVRKHWRRILRDYLISIAFWMIAAMLSTWQDARLSAIEHMNWTLRMLAILYSIRFFVVALLTPPIFYCVQKWPLRSGKDIGRAFAYILGFIPFTVGFAAIRWLMFPPWYPETQTWGPRTLDSLTHMLYEMFADEFLTYLSIVIAAHALAYFVWVRRQQLDQLELKQALAQSELQTLKAQLQPHFLFNTLHAISTLVQDNPRQARSMIVGLSSLLRRTLQRQGADLVPLDDDLTFARDYLEIQSMRLGDRLRIEWKIQPETRRLLVPELILQPLLENAIKHGIAPCRDGGWLEIISEEKNGKLRIQIRNSANGTTSEAGLGVGHHNVEARLNHLYGSDAKFYFHRAPDQALAELEFPILTGAAGIATSTPTPKGI
jgi:two-component system, LytTR family, sensor kinase